MRRSILVTLLTALLLPAAAGAEEPRRVAFLGVKLLDMSMGTTSDAERSRLAMLEDRLEAAFAAAPGYAMVDTAPVADRLDRISNIADCNGCDARLAGDLGADLAMTGEVQKTSNLILHISVYLRDAETGALVGGGSADIRGNTDESWRRGIDW